MELDEKWKCIRNHLSLPALNTIALQSCLGGKLFIWKFNLHHVNNLLWQFHDTNFIHCIRVWIFKSIFNPSFFYYMYTNWFRRLSRYYVWIDQWKYRWSSITFFRAIHQIPNWKLIIFRTNMSRDFNHS